MFTAKLLVLAKKRIQRSCKRSSQNLEKSTELELVARMIVGFVCTSLFKSVIVHKVTLVGPSSTERVKDASNLVHLLHLPSFRTLVANKGEHEKLLTGDHWQGTTEARRDKRGTCFHPTRCALRANLLVRERSGNRVVSTWSPD